MNEELFRLWMGGYSLVEIFRLYQNTPRSFMYKTLLNAKSRYEWDRRKAIILQEISAEQTEAIKASRRDQLQAIQMVMSMNIDKIRRDYLTYMEDPDKYCKTQPNGPFSRPAWLSNSINELMDLMKTHNYVASGGEKVVPADQTDLPKLELSNEVAAKIWDILKQTATEKALKQLPDNTIIVENNGK